MWFSRMLFKIDCWLYLWRYTISLWFSIILILSNLMSLFIFTLSFLWPIHICSILHPVRLLIHDFLCLATHRCFHPCCLFRLLISILAWKMKVKMEKRIDLADHRNLTGNVIAKPGKILGLVYSETTKKSYTCSWHMHFFLNGSDMLEIFYKCQGK